MRFFFVILISFSSMTCFGQIGNYNTFPSLPPLHLLDNVNLLQDISFAYSMRLLESDHEAPLVRLRRESDDSERDFFCNQEDKVNVTEIDNWRGNSNVFVTIWYDQSGQNRDAIQTDLDRQPALITNPVTPYIQFDGTNDSLLVEGTINEVVANGKNATITGVYWATNRADFGFGAINPANNRDRWITHFNWSDRFAYFDPGYCCNNPRRFRNDFPTSNIDPGKLEAWGQYTVIRRGDPTNATIDRIIMKLDGVLKLNGDFPNNIAFTRTTFPFAIGAYATNDSGSNTRGNANMRFAEIIAHREGKTDKFVNEIEQNQITFWRL